MKRQHFLRLGISTAASMAMSGWLMPTASVAQSAKAFPQKLVTIVVPVPAGGLQDGLARALAQELARRWKQTVIVDNRAGASGAIAAGSVARAPADGYTILISDNVSLVTNQILRDNLPYDVMRSFIAVSSIAQMNDVLLVSANSPIKSFDDLVAAAKAKPGTFSYGSFGVGTVIHIDTDALTKAVGIKAVHVPYKGGAEVMQALASGDQISFSLVGLTSGLPMIKTGRVRALAYAGRQRTPLLPDVPTLAECGIAGFESNARFSLYVPAGTPATVVDVIAASTAEVAKDPAFVEHSLTSLGFEPLVEGPAGSQASLQSDFKRYTAIIKDSGIKESLR